MTTAFKLFINGEERTPPGSDVDNTAEWDVTWEERVEGAGAASVTVQDRSNSAIYGRKRDEIKMVVDAPEQGLADFPVFHGELTRSRLDLPAGRPFRRWKASATDFNTVLDLRLLGVADGRSWHTIDGGQSYTAYDPEAHAIRSDAHVVAHLFDQYVRLPAGFSGGTLVHAGPPGGRAFHINHYVFHHLNDRILIEPSSGQPRLAWTSTTLRSALDELGGLAAFPIFGWIDPGDDVHWEALHDPFTAPGGLTTMGPHHLLRRAPAIVTDDESLWDGSTTIGGRGLWMEYDGTYMPEQAYVNGVTDFIHAGGTTRYQGTGWRHRGIADPEKRQILVDAQAVTEAQRDSIARHYEKFGQRARIKGEVTVGKPAGRTPAEVVDGFRCGQYITIYDARLPASLNGKAWPILSVKGSLKAGNDFRVYQIGFGDVPTERFSQKYRAGPQRLRTKRLPANTHRIYLPTPHLRPSSTYILKSQMVDHSRKPVRQAGVPVTWSLEVRDRNGVAVATGSISAITSTTDEHGRTAATLMTGTPTDVHYHASCVTAAVAA